MRTARVELALLPWRGSAYAGLPSPHIVEVGVGFEPTDDLKPPAVFETAALSQALPTYRYVVDFGKLVSDTIFSLFGRP